MPDTDTATVETTFLTKMSVKTMGCKPARAKAEEKNIPLAQIIGIASGVKHKVDNRGEAITAITGDFEGINLETRDVYRSSVLYLPSGIHETLEAPLTRDDSEPIQFGIEIIAAPASNPIGYSYTARQLIKQDAADPLAILRSKLPQLLPKPEVKPTENKSKKGK